MSPDLALKIAAGEVVERPASAVKELIDNAVDAGATGIRIDVRDAGLKLIRVTDNGFGIPADELPLAFTSHATSKIASMDDLEHLATLGFRGEALPSIAAVARVEVQTRVAEETAGTRYRVEYGTHGHAEVCAAPAGTRFTVTDLFGNVPARRKFVRSLRAEAGQIQQVVMQYAMGQPGIHFALSIDDRLTFESPGTNRLNEAVAAVYGVGVLESMETVQYQEGGIEVVGLISEPDLSRSNRSAIHLFVNGRPIASRSLTYALEEAYSGYLMTGRHPLAVVHLHVSAGDVDPNIHPSKSEVRFAREREVHGILHRAVSSTLFERRLAQGGAIEHVEGSIDGAKDVPLPLDASELLPETPTLLPEIPVLRVFGQTNTTFIIAEGPHGVYMIDQHAAHERVLFDELDAQLENGPVLSQALLEPIPVPLEPLAMQALEDYRELMERAGFTIDPFGHDACLVRAVPAISSNAPPVELVHEVLRELQALPEPAAARERALAAMACKAAVKAGQPLELREMRELVLQLERTPRPATCPHGRPTMIHLSHSQLEREFGRR